MHWIFRKSLTGERFHVRIFASIEYANTKTLNQKSIYQTDVQRVASCCECDTNGDIEWAGELHERKGN